jgi:hypothetical protein
MTNLINLVPFLAGGFLLINPLLFIIFQRWEINIQKLRFWYMMTSAITWILLLLILLISPDKEFGLGSISETSLLPGPVFRLDWISISMALTVGGLVLFSALSQVFSPQQIAWISGIGGISILGSHSGSVYTLLFFWALIEVFWVTYSALYQSRDRGLILPVAFRLLVPLLLIYASGVGIKEGIGDSFSTYDKAAAPLMIAAGGLGIGAWIPFRRRFSDDDPGRNPEFLARYFPASISLMLITRGAALVDNSLIAPFLPVLAGILTLAAGLLGLISRSEGFSRRIWSVGLLGMMVGSSLISSPVNSLGWGLVFLLPVSTLFFPFRDRSRLFIVLVISALGILTLPYFPAWIGRGLFGNGAAGVLFSIGAGLVLGGVLQGGINRFRKSSPPEGKIPILYLISPVIILLTQSVLAIPHLSKDIGIGLLTQPVMIWIPLPMIILTVLFGNRIQDLWSTEISDQPGKTLDIIPEIIYRIVDLGDRLVSFVTRLFEGEGGLIWALLIGFLIITLITIRGGS